MGYEVRYSFHERTADGFNKEETKEMVKRVGTAYEEVSPEKLAGTIMGQLVRRDIWIVDVEVFEYSKKKIAFKESNGGVVIKGRKYSFEGANIVADDVEPTVEEVQQQEASQAQQHRPQAPLAVRGTHQAYPVGPDAPSTANVNLADQMYFRTRKPLRYEVYQPDQLVAAEARARRLPFTVGKQYPIYEERVLPNATLPGVSYITVNDLGQKMVLSDRHFIQPQNLSRGFRDTNMTPQEVNLDYGNTVEMDMPSLR